MRILARACLLGKDDSQPMTEITDALPQRHCGSSNELINQHASTESVPGCLPWAGTVRRAGARRIESRGRNSSFFLEEESSPGATVWAGSPPTQRCEGLSRELGARLDSS